MNILGSCGLTKDRLREIISENIIRWIIIAVLNNKKKLQVTECELRPHPGNTAANMVGYMN